MRKLLILILLLSAKSACAQQVELACASGTVPVPALIGRNQSTGGVKYNACVDSTGLIPLGGVTPDSQNLVYATNHGVLANWKEFYGSSNGTLAVSSGSAVVPCTGCYTLVTDVGKLIVATNAGSTIASDVTYTTAVSLFPAGTTILSVQSANSATMSANATGNCSGTVCEFAFGTNDDAAWVATDAAFQALNTCGTVIFPSGLTNWNIVNKFNLAPISCTAVTQTNTATQTNSGPQFMGFGPASSVIILTPTFKANVGSCQANGCMFNIPNAIVKDIGIKGYGQSDAGASTTVNLIGAFYGAYYQNVSVSGFMGGNQSTSNVGVNCVYCSLDNFKSDGFGGVGFLATSYSWVTGNSYFLNNYSINYECGAICYDYGLGIGNDTTGKSGSTNYYCFGSCYSNGLNQQYAGGSNAWQQFQVNTNGNLYLTDFNGNGGVTGTTGLYMPATNANVYLRGTNAFFGGATAAQFLITGGATNKIYNQGTLLLGGTANVNLTGSIGSFTPYQSVRGSCTGVATAASTLGLYGTGPNETLTTCTSAAIGSGIVMDHPCTVGSGFTCLSILQVTATAAGTNASSGVVTVLKNGVATTITCTIGTGTSCFDGTHFVSFVAGDLISIQFTTQAADTLAGIKALVSAY